MSSRGFRRHGLVLVALVFAAVPAASSPPNTWGQEARRHVVALAEGIGSRLAGSPAEAQAADYIERVFRELGYLPSRQTFRFAPEDPRRGRSLESANLIAVHPGESTRQIIVGAHYDSEVLGRGADDNASGVGVLLEVAAAIRAARTPHTIRFIAFGAEEQGLRGAHAYVDAMSEGEIRDTIVMINLDSLIAGDHAYVYGSDGPGAEIRDWLVGDGTPEFGIRTQSGENPRYSAGTTGDFSDHAPFRQAGISYLYFESTNWALGDRDGYTQVDARYGDDGRIWHTDYDTIDYIDRTFPGRADARLELFGSLLHRILTRFVPR